MKKALQIYNLVNLLHILFYVYILVRRLNIGSARALIQDNAITILVVYLVVFIALSRYAKKIGNGLENPMRTVKAARVLHFISIAIFVLALIMVQKYDEKFILLILISFLVEMFAFISAYRGSVIREDRTDVIDDVSDDQLD